MQLVSIQNEVMCSCAESIHSKLGVSAEKAFDILKMFILSIDKTNRTQVMGLFHEGNVKTAISSSIYIDAEHRTLNFELFTAGITPDQVTIRNMFIKLGDPLKLIKGKINGYDPYEEFGKFGYLDKTYMRTRLRESLGINFGEAKEAYFVGGQQKNFNTFAFSLSSKFKNMDSEAVFNYINGKQTVVVEDLNFGNAPISSFDSSFRYMKTVFCSKIFIMISSPYKFMPVSVQIDFLVAEYFRSEGLKKFYGKNGILAEHELEDDSDFTDSLVDLRHVTSQDLSLVSFFKKYMNNERKGASFIVCVPSMDKLLIGLEELTNMKCGCAIYRNLLLGDNTFIFKMSNLSVSYSSIAYRRYYWTHFKNMLLENYNRNFDLTYGEFTLATNMVGNRNIMLQVIRSYKTEVGREIGSLDELTLVELQDLYKKILLKKGMKKEIPIDTTLMDFNMLNVEEQEKYLDKILDYTDNLEMSVVIENLDPKFVKLVEARRGMDVEEKNY